MKLEQDEDRMLNGSPEDEEEENKEDDRITIEEDVGGEMRDIEDEPDENLGLVAPDKSNKEEQEGKTDENKGATGGGEQEEIGEGKEDENNQGGMNDKDEEQEELKSIKKELQIVQRKILKGQNLKEGGDDKADEGIILPAEEAEDHGKQEEQKEDESEKDQEENAEQDGQGEQAEEAEEAKRYNKSEEDTGIAHVDFECLIDQNDIEQERAGKDESDFNKNEKKANISESSRRKWEDILVLTRESAADLCEQLRLVLEATVAAKMRGDFRAGKRLNMRKIIPFIASGFRKDKIWMRRVEPDQRNCQVLLAVDDSLSMRDNTGEMALESIALITQALALLGIGELCVAKFGESTEIVHPLGGQWSDESGGNLIESFDFSEEHTNYDELLAASISCLPAVQKGGSAQLLFITSDAAQTSRKEDATRLVIGAQLKSLVVVFALIDSQDAERRRSVLETFSLTPSGKLSHFLDEFPFYVLIKDPRKLPERLADALRQWFELANNQ